jgi:hypothetical protein
VEETRTCPRCGGFYCDGCLPEALESERTHCPDCLERDNVTDPVRLRRTLMRDMALVHCGVAVALVVIGVLGAMSAPSDKELYVLAGGTCFAAVFLGFAGLLTLTRNTAVGWGVFALDVVLGGAFLFLGGILDGSAVLIAAVISCLQLVRARGLSRAHDPA